MTSEIKMMRIRKGLTQKDLAKAIGVTPQYICAVENGKKAISKEVATRIMKILDSKFDFEELRTATMPLVEYLRKHGNPLTKAIVTQTSVDIMNALAGDRFKFDD